ncbi:MULTISPECIES: HEAT repeat domain-containing protein [Sorangium]|uniref:HEAT repeat domain-containing protein n=1 Tax=Sorangium cellulosum (strain So ce56) TaxID=448385 RepID=A9FA19_SORC5|nr:hypothetical protein [Sorangium cellulosum]CAN94827.1 hypothetical protein sce4664 [Sorangium cellulosum So ce56]
MANSNVGISIDVSAPAAPVLLAGPIPAVVVVHNRSAAPIDILLPYPNVNDLRFESPSATQRPTPSVGDERTIAIPIPPGQRYASTYYLNRYLRFDVPGDARVKYQLDVHVTVSPRTPEASNKEITAAGELTFHLIQGTEDALKEVLSNHAANLRSKDRKVKMEAAEALAFLETPLALEAQARMLTIDGLEVIGIEALGRSSSPQAHKLIVGMLSRPDSMVVMAALAEIDRLRLDLPREKVHALLASDNPNIRWTALDWMAAHPDPRDRAAVSPLLGDPNTEVRERAKAYLESLPK